MPFSFATALLLAGFQTATTAAPEAVLVKGEPSGEVAAESAASKEMVADLGKFIGPVARAPMADEDRFNACLDLATDDPASGVIAANEWLIGGGGYFARHCLGFAYAKEERWAAAADSFVSAARDAELVQDMRAANLWTQAGNAALASGDPERALTCFDAAMALGIAEGLLLGELQLDRARALVAAGRADEAEAAFAQAHRLVPEDPLAWLLSATLARRQGRLERAQADIDVAARLAPRDPEVALEAGNIAASAGRYDIARRNWNQAIEIRPDGPVAATARAHLSELDGAEAEPAAATR